MSQVPIRAAAAGIFFVLISGVARAQSHGAWFMENYHFTGPPPPGEVKAVDPVLTELKEIQASVRSIMRSARLEGDYETALAAAAQAVANAQLIGAVIEHQQAAQAPPPVPPATAAAEHARLDRTQR
jgi:hypothetical protein